MFNQCLIISELIRSSLKKNLEIQISYDSVVHKGKYKPQASLPHEKRISNVKNAFTVKNNSLKNKTILLVDDVLTTGATSTELAITLLEHGAQTIDLLVLARSPQWVESRQEIASYFGLFTA